MAARGEEMIATAVYGSNPPGQRRALAGSHEDDELFKPPTTCMLKNHAGSFALLYTRRKQPARGKMRVETHFPRSIFMKKNLLKSSKTPIWLPLPVGLGGLAGCGWVVSRGEFPPPSVPPFCACASLCIYVNELCQKKLPLLFICRI